MVKKKLVKLYKFIIDFIPRNENTVSKTHLYIHYNSCDTLIAFMVERIRENNPTQLDLEGTQPTLNLDIEDSEPTP